VTPASAAVEVLRLDGVSKRFGELVANEAISLSLAQGEVLALLGENGAGKSTLVSILFGHYVADAGSIRVFGQPLPPGDTGAALRAGIGMVHQHFTLADNLSVLDNVLIGHEPLTRWYSARRAMRARLLDASATFGLAVDPDARVADLSVGERQRVEILKALVRGARILILDEPTAVLTPQESEALFATLRRFVAQGLSMIFISHKLDEVMRISDRVAVLRGGRLVAQSATREASAGALAMAMIGRALEMPRRAPDAATVAPSPGGSDAPALAVHDVCVREAGRTVLDSARLAVRRGEIVAIAGVAGNGQQALADVLTGLRAQDSGQVSVEGRSMPATPRAWIDAGVARIPEDRVSQGVLGDASLAENAWAQHGRRPDTLRWPRLARWLAIRDHRRMREAAGAIAATFDVRHASLDQPIRMLSGGNIQKFILGRELSPGPSLIIANQPTWGLDVGAVAFVHGQLLAARARGAAVLLISEELEEIFALADRIAVMFQGRLGEARPAEQWTPQRIGLAMAGQSEAAEDGRDAIGVAA
jgi:simple sugar transport system ATP-binding protein